MSVAVTTSATIRPNLVPVSRFGHHSSRVEGDKRHWIFESREGADAFTDAIEAGEFRREAAT